MQQPEADARAWGGARSAESNHHVPACRLNPSNLADAAPNATGPSSKTCLCDNTAKPVPHAPARDTDRAVGTPVRGAPRPRRKVVIAATAVPRIPRLRAPLPTVRPASDWANPRQFWIVHALWPIPPQTKAELTSTKGGARLYPCYIPKPLTPATQPLRLGCKIKAHLDDRVAHAVVEMCLVCAPET